MSKFFIPVFSVLLTFLAQVAFAQTLKLNDSQVKYDKITYPCIEVVVEPNPDDVKSAWEDFIKDKHDVKMKGYGFLTNKDVLRAEKKEFKAISDNQLDFYTRIVEEKDDRTKMCVFASFGYDIHVNPDQYPREYAAMKNILKNFLKSYLPGYYNERISSTEDRLKDLRDEREDLESELNDNKKQIEELTKRNKELEKNLTENQQKIDAANETLKVKERNFKNVKDRLKTFDSESDK